MTEPIHKKSGFSRADLLFLKCPCTVTLALGLTGKSNGIFIDIVIAVLVLFRQMCLIIMTQSWIRI